MTNPRSPRLLPQELESEYWQKVIVDPREKAIWGAFERQHVTFAYLQTYARDPKFVRALLAFYRSHRLALTVLLNLTDHTTYSFDTCGYRCDWRMRAFATDFRAFLKEWRLDLLPDDVGRTVIHSWCISHRDGTARYKKPEPGLNDVHTLGRFARGDGWERARVGDVIYDRSGFYTDDDGVSRFHENKMRRPLIHIPAVDIEWSVLEEARASIRERLLRYYEQQIDADLDRLQEAHEQAGYVFPEKRYSQEQHLQWLYQRVRYRESCENLAARVDDGQKNSQSIQKATKEYADILGIRIPRPHKRKF